MTLRRLIAISVWCVMIASFAVMWLMFTEMWRTGTPMIRVVADRYGEFKIEAALYAVSMVLLPVAIYELDASLRDD